MEFAGKYIPEELVMEFMLSSDRYSLQDICRTNKLTAEICRDEYFWKRKLQIDFQTDERLPNKSYKETWIIMPYISRVKLGIVGESGIGIYDPLTHFVPQELAEQFKTAVRNSVEQFNEEDTLGIDETVHYLDIEKDDNDEYYLVYYIENEFGFPRNPEGTFFIESINDFLGQEYYNEDFVIEMVPQQGFDGDDLIDVDMFRIPYFGEDIN
jgi:hypothetical protein